MKKQNINHKKKKNHEGLIGKLLSWFLLLIMVGAMFAGILVYLIN